MRVLFVVSSLRVANGVARVLMNQYDSLIQNGYEIDFLQFYEFDSPYVEKIKKNNGKIYTIKRDFSALKSIREILKTNHYDIVHINQMNFQTVYLIMCAKFLKIKNIIYHSHNTKIPGGFKRNILEKACNFVYSNLANRLLACSVAAGKDAFGKKEFLVLKNSIDVKKYSFNKEIREKIRKEYGISNDTFVVGTVCRYAKQKSPILMINIISEIIKIKPNSIFLWVGSAPSEEDPIIKEMNNRVDELHIRENILWVGSKADVYNWYSVMDVFMMPSQWEGLGITYLEAQANSLPTFATNVVPEETKITDLIEFYPLDYPTSEWAKEICKHGVRNNFCDIDNYERFAESGYDIDTAKNDLLKIYNDFSKLNNK